MLRPLLLLSALAFLAGCGHQNKDERSPVQDSVGLAPFGCQATSVAGHLKIVMIDEMSPRKDSTQWLTVFYRPDESKDQGTVDSILGNARIQDGTPFVASYSRACIESNKFAVGQHLRAILYKFSGSGCTQPSVFFVLNDVAEDCRKI